MPGPLPIGQVRMKKYFLGKNTTSLRGPDSPFLRPSLQKFYFSFVLSIQIVRGLESQKCFVPGDPTPAIFPMTSNGVRRTFSGTSRYRNVIVPLKYYLWTIFCGNVIFCMEIYQLHFILSMNTRRRLKAVVAHDTYNYSWVCLMLWVNLPVFNVLVHLKVASLLQVWRSRLQVNQP